MARQRTKKKVILKSTLELIADKGFHGMSMSDLAKHAGISPGTVYVYYKSKDDLIVDLFHVIRLEMEEAILHEFNSSLDLHFQYNLLTSNLIKYYLKNKHAFLFMEQFYLSPFMEHVFEAFSGKVVDSFKEIYSKGLQEGVFKNLPLEVMTSLIYGPIVSLVRKHHNNLFQINDETISQIISASFKSILK